MNTLLQYVFEGLKIVDLIKNPLTFEEVHNTNLRNVIVIGNIGSGKSTTLNKLAYVLDHKTGEIENVFLSKVSAHSVTLKTEERKFGNLNLIDTQGFNDPTNEQNILWEKLSSDMTSTNDIVTKRSNGLSAVVVPIMVPLSKRVEDQSVQIVFEMLMNFSIFNALNDLWQ